MTREEIENEYAIVDGRIQDPGKFEGEPVYTPYFWDAFLNGIVDEDDGETLVFNLTAEDREEFPELEAFKQVLLWEDDQGFVRARKRGKREYAE